MKFRFFIDMALLPVKHYQFAESNVDSWNNLYCGRRGSDSTAYAWM